MRTIVDKVILSIFLIISISLSSQISVEKGFEKIPDSLYFRDGIYQYIKPNINYTYWKVSRRHDSLRQELIYEKKAKDKTFSSNYSPNTGFFHECRPGDCFSFIIAYRNAKAKYFSNEEELRNFIGFVDNLSEALLIIRTYGFWFDSSNIIGGAYKFDDNYIYLFASKFESCPVKKESFIIKINRKTQEIETKSNGVYYKSDNCYTS